jgi:NAD(P)-dependent dehydrogenase (short-subunit alcohol dehydrogenase family)
MANNNKVAIITGGGSGLGLAIAEKMVAENIQTIIIGRNEAKMIQACTKMGDLCSYLICDLAHLEAIPELVKTVKEDFGGIDILVNNAGVHLKKPITEVTDQEFENIIKVNLTAVFALSREVAKVMLQQGRGSILNISSMAAQYGIPQVIAYTAAKTGVEGMTRAMAVELSPGGVRVNCLAPGFIETEMSAKALNSDPERKNKVLGRTPMGKLGTPLEVAEAAFYLCSDNASYLTGVILPVDGGNSIGF